MINLRPYQKEAIKNIKDTFKKEKRQYIQMPTGSGKTVTFLSYAKENHKKILVIVPSKELLKQVCDSALLFFEPWEITRKGASYDEDFIYAEDWEIKKHGSIKNIPTLHICIINSIRGDYLELLSAFCFDLIIIDEAHHAQAASYKRFIDIQTSCHKNACILGVTATPERADGRFLNEILHTCSYKTDIETLIGQGFLCDIEGFSVKTKIDLSDVDSHNGDFSLNQLYKKLCKEIRNNLIVDLCKLHMNDRKTLIFCINISHSKQISCLLNENGISSKHIDGSMNAEERNSILSSFRNGEISVICNCQLLTEGFDEPSIDGIMLARPTKSRALFTQMIGRGLRISNGKKNCKLIDIVDNHKNLSGFNSIISPEIFPEILSFSSIKDISDHIGKELIKVTEFEIERIDIFSNRKIYNNEAMPSMIEYLESNNVEFHQPINFDDASFLIWYNELKKEYAHGNN